MKIDIAPSASYISERFGMGKPYTERSHYP